MVLVPIRTPRGFSCCLLTLTLCTIGVITLISLFDVNKLKTGIVPGDNRNNAETSNKTSTRFIEDASDSNWKDRFFTEALSPLITGHKPSSGSERKFLSIGISTVYRKEGYLRQTLESFINQSTPEERPYAVIVIYLADSDPWRKEQQLHLILENFFPQIQSGFLQIIASSQDIYPSMNFALTRRTHGDSTDRVIWRAKQVIDFAFLLTYVQSLSKYHLVVEDDLIASNGYLSAIRDYIDQKTKDGIDWRFLVFSDFISIGLLHETRGLRKIVDFLLIFYQEEPVDVLINQFINIERAGGIGIQQRVPSIFQHMGTSSTLPNKVQKLKDSSFGSAKRKLKNKNPPAKVLTTMKIYQDFVPSNVLKSYPAYFWGIPVKPEATFDLIFDHPLNLSRILIVSGLSNASGASSPFKDLIADGELQLSEGCSGKSLGNVAVAPDFKSAESFQNGTIDYRDFTSLIQCIRIKLGKGQKTWVIITEIEIVLQ